MKRTAGLFLVVTVLALIGIANFSEVSTRYECAGTLDSQQVSKEVTAFARVSEYRWWVGFWSDSDGDLTLEMPGLWIEYIPSLRSLGSLDRFQLLTVERRLQGDFSTLSGRLFVETSIGVFAGTCRVIH